MLPKAGVISPPMRFLCTWALLLLVAPTALPAQGPSADNDPIVFVKKGVAQNKKGDYNGAIDSFTRALVLDPTDSAALEGRGESRFRQGDLTDAISDFSKALALEPKNSDALLFRGKAREAQGDFKGAINDLDQAIHIAGESGHTGPLFTERGRANYLQGDFNGAIADFNQAVAADPGSGEGYFYRGLAEEDNAQPAAALDDFAKAAPLGVPEAALWWWMAEMENHHEDDASAGLPPLLNKGLASHPDTWLAELGNLLLQKTTETQVQADAQGGKAWGNRQSQAWFFIGLSREFSGDTPGARQAYQKVIDGGAPDSPFTVESARRMKKLLP